MNHKFWLWAFALGLALPPALFGAQAADLADLRQLNADNLRAFLACDVARYRELLADDFQCVLADGHVIGKAEFLQQAAAPPALTGFRSEEPQIRLYGDTALIIARIGYRRPDGTAIQTRYIDVCLRRDGRWRIESAQFTRVAVGK
jgi:ketosteroid isomerase-like protein